MAGQPTARTTPTRRRRRHQAEAELLRNFDLTLRPDLRRLEHHIELCELHPSEVDGYKTSHGFDVIGGGTQWIVDEDGRPVSVSATTVEAAAILRTARTINGDPHAAAVLRGERARAELCVAWSKLCAAIRDMDNAQRNDDVTDVKHCQSCLRAGVKVGENTGDPLTWSGAHLPDKQWLCEPCRRFTSEHERLPSLAEVQDFNNRGRKRWRAVGESATRNRA